MLPDNLSAFGMVTSTAAWLAACSLLLLQMTLRRALSPMLPNLDAQLVPYSRSRAGQSASRPVASACHSPPTTSNPPAQGGVHLLGDLSHALHHHQAEKQGDSPTHVPLASKFSLSSIEGHNPVLQQAGKEEEQNTTGISAQPSHQHLPFQNPVAATGAGTGVNGFGAASRPRDAFVAQTPQASARTPKEELVAQQGYSGMSTNRQQPLHSRQPDGGHMEGSGIVNVKPGRVTVDTAGTFRRTVITVAELQSTAQPEAYLRAHHEAPVVNRLASPASASASQCVSDAAAGAQPSVARPTHAHTSQQLSVQPSTSAEGLSREAAVLQYSQSYASHSQDRALQNSPALNSADHRANSPLHEGKASSKSPAQQQAASRRSDDGDAILHSQEAVLDSALVNAIQDVQHAQNDRAVASAVQALQLQTSHASTATVQVHLPQVCSLRKCMHACMMRVCGLAQVLSV